MKNFLKITSFLAAFLLSAPAFALCGTGTGTCFWVGGGTNTNWNSSPTTNWSISSGGVDHTQAPVAGDAIIFDANSGTTASVFNVSLSVASFDASASSALTLTHSTATTLTITGASFKIGANMTFTVGNATTSAIALNATSGTVTIDTNGKSLGSTTLGTSGTATWQLASPLAVNKSFSSTLTLAFGTLDLNGQALTVGTFSSSNSNTRQINLSANVNVTCGSSTSWDMTTSTGLTVSLTGGGSITMSAPLAVNTVCTFNGGGKTFNDLILTGGTATGVYALLGANTFSHLTALNSANIKFPTSATQTVQNPLVWTGTNSAPLYIYSSAAGSQATIVYSGASTAAWASFRDIAFSSTSNFTATNSNNFGNNTISGGGALSISAPSAGGGGGHIIGG